MASGSESNISSEIEHLNLSVSSSDFDVAENRAEIIFACQFEPGFEENEAETEINDGAEHTDSEKDDVRLIRNYW